jgi:hypothetical protein
MKNNYSVLNNKIFLNNKYCCQAVYMECNTVSL